MTTVLIAQLNYGTNNVVGNKERLISICTEAANFKPDLVLFSRYAIPGYFEEAPVLASDFSEQCLKSIGDLATKTEGMHLIVGSILVENGSFCEIVYHITPEGEHRELLRSYATSPVSATSYAVFEINGLKAVLLLEDTGSSIIETANHIPADADLLIVLGKSQRNCGEFLTPSVVPDFVKRSRSFIYLNMIGGYASAVFAGGSVVSTTEGTQRLAMWKEDLLLLDLAKGKPAAVETNVHKTPCSTTSIYPSGCYNITSGVVKDYLDTEESVTTHRRMSPAADNTDCLQEFIYQGLMLAVRDFINKNSLSGVVLGLSGGIDSALMATIAADSLGVENVRTYMLPTRYTSQLSMEDARECASRIGVMHTVISIEEAFRICTSSLQASLNMQNWVGTVEENIQSRIRGVFLMAISNSTNLLLLATGNKSEALTGYMTLYGDTCGGFAPLKSLYKTKVYELARWRNQNIPNLSKCKKIDIIPASIIDKPPSAELKFGQRDQDTLPEYDRLDQMLELLIDKKLSKEQVARCGFTKEEVNLVEHLVKRSYFKLSQVAPGPTIIC